MAIRKLLILLLTCTISLLHAQEEKVYFDDALSQHLRTYNQQSDLALKKNKPSEVDSLFKTFVNQHLKYSYISDLTLKKVTGGKLHTKNLTKPFLLITKNSAIIQTRAEINEINQLASRYKDNVAIIVVYWNKKKIAKQKSRRYTNDVIVVYAYERQNTYNNALSIYKHSFGVPACFYISKDKQIFDIDRTFFMKNIKTSTRDVFVEKTSKSITEMLNFENYTQAQKVNSDITLKDKLK